VASRRLDRVEHDQPKGTDPHGVLHEVVTGGRGHPRMVGERRAQRRAVVMVARQQVHRHRQRREQPTQVFVFGGAAEVDQVPPVITTACGSCGSARTEATVAARCSAVSTRP
jgi:hypothetical protein